MLALTKRNNDLFKKFFNDDWLDFPLQSFARVWPPADIYEDKERMVVELEVPGIDQKEVDVSIDGNILTVKGEKVSKIKQESADYLRAERYQGSFSRSFTLPSYLDSSKISASYEHGVLRIEIGKKQTSTPKRIEIKNR